jgi:S-DNA-T family DNA segregation ATPase FtsK/SpoIIIE
MKFFYRRGLFFVRKNRITKDKKYSDAKINREAVALFFAFASFLSAYMLIVPDKGGAIGRVFFVVLLSIFGTASYALPFIFLWHFMIHIKQSLIKVRKKIDFIWSLVCLVFLSAFFEIIRFIFKLKISGGWIGSYLHLFFKDIFDIQLEFIIIAIILLLSITNLLRISVVSVVYNFFKELNMNIKKSKKSKSQGNFATRQKSAYEFSEQIHTKPKILRKLEIDENKKNDIVVNTVAKHKIIYSKNFNYKLPTVDLLKNDFKSKFAVDKDELLRRAELLRRTLADFYINVEVKDIIPGPVVTRYDLVLAPGTRIQAVFNIVDNLSLTMRTTSLRVVPIPEKSAIGIEVPNPLSVVVGLRDILESKSFENSRSLLTLALGKTTGGLGYVADLASMPHLLIAGATGSGKSVGVHTIILSILYKARPNEVKFMLIDPKRVEMSIYRNIPHLYNPCSNATDADIITTPKEVAVALKKLVVVMEERYIKFAKYMVRNIEDYNSKIVDVGGEHEFYIVVVIDELADLMLTVQKEIEDSIQRLAQMARAVGIHLILATQRPSVNVITGTIKANFPARISFQTTSKIDSRVILDMTGSESLIGRGDMLFLAPGETRPVRLQGAFASLQESKNVISFINSQNFPRIYESLPVDVGDKSGFNACDERRNRDLIPALKLINNRRRVSHDLLKANFGGSARSTNILSILEVEGFISKPEGTNKWHLDFDKISQYLKDNM